MDAGSYTAEPSPQDMLALIRFIEDADAPLDERIAATERLLRRCREIAFYCDPSVFTFYATFVDLLTSNGYVWDGLTLRAAA